jgi:hypothetical protein
MNFPIFDDSNPKLWKQDAKPILSSMQSLLRGGLGEPRCKFLALGIC